MTIRYTGNNGLEYLTAFDAEKYGEGLKQTTEYLPPKIIVNTAEEKPAYDTLKVLGEVSDVVVPSTELLEKKEEVAPALDESTETFFAMLENGSDEALKDIAKGLDIKGYAQMKRDNLISRIKTTTIEKKSLA